MSSVCKGESTAPLPHTERKMAIFGWKSDLRICVPHRTSVLDGKSSGQYWVSAKKVEDQKLRRLCVPRMSVVHFERA